MACEPLLDGADRLEILVEADAVGRAALAFHGGGVLHHEIEHAGVIALQRGEHGGMLRIDARQDGRAIAAEEAVEGELRDDLLGHGRVRIAPGDEGAVEAREAAAGGVDAGARRFEAELDRRERGTVADALRGELIDGGGAGVEIVAHGALDVAAGEPDRDLGPVAVAPDGVLVPEVLEEDEVVLEAGEGLQVRGDFVVFAIARRGPVLRPDAVRQEHEHHAEGRFGEGLRRVGRGLRHGLEPRQSQCGSGAAQKCPSGNRSEHPGPP